jgi:hypothetical protein
MKGKGKASVLFEQFFTRNPITSRVNVEHTYLREVDGDHEGHCLCSGAGPYTSDSVASAERDAAPLGIQSQVSL